MLQGTSGQQSNLVLRTLDGEIYTYTLKYRDSLSDYSFRIKRVDKIRLKDSIAIESKPLPEKSAEIKDRKETYYQKLSAYFASNWFAVQTLIVEACDGPSPIVWTTCLEKGLILHTDLRFMF